jgi:nitroreductase
MQDHANSNVAAHIEESLAERFGERLPVDPALAGLDELARIAGHRVHRDFLDRPVEPALLRLLCACALSAPSKSDLQQADILVVDDADQRRELIAFMPDMPWLDDAPVLLVFLANGARTPALARRRDKPFRTIMSICCSMRLSTAPSCSPPSCARRPRWAWAAARSAPFAIMPIGSARCCGCLSA